MTDLILNFAAMTYAVIVSFVLTSAGRNRRQVRPHGRAITYAGHVAFSASATLALLCAGWAAMMTLGWAGAVA